MGLIGDAWSADPDLGNRDPNNLNDHLQVAYEEVLGEPDHTHSLECVWKCSYKCFNLWKTLCYVIGTTLFGICIAMMWGCYFAEVAFWHIWYFTPLLKAIEIWLSIVKKLYGMCMSGCLDPCCISCGHIFDAFRK